MEKNNFCATCIHFDRYYSNEITEFKKTNFGQCGMRYKVVKDCETCLNYSNCPNVKAFIVKTIKVRLAEIFAELTTLRNYLENENEI